MGIIYLALVLEQTLDPGSIFYHEMEELTGAAPKKAAQWCMGCLVRKNDLPEVWEHTCGRNWYRKEAASVIPRKDLNVIKANNHRESRQQRTYPDCSTIISNWCPVNLLTTNYPDPISSSLLALMSYHHSCRLHATTTTASVPKLGSSIKALAPKAVEYRPRKSETRERRKGKRSS